LLYNIVQSGVDASPHPFRIRDIAFASLSAGGYNAPCRPLANGFKSPANCGGGGVERLLSDSCCYGQSIYDADRTGVTSYMEIDAADVPGYPILTLHYGAARRFFEEAREAGGRALIHCELGVNRSATLAVAYLVDTEQVATGSELVCVCVCVCACALRHGKAGIPRRAGFSWLGAWGPSAHLESLSGRL